MDALTSARAQIKNATYSREGPENREEVVLLAIANALVAVCERMDQWLEMQDLEAERAEVLQESDFVSV